MQGGLIECESCGVMSIKVRSEVSVEAKNVAPECES